MAINKKLIYFDMNVALFKSNANGLNNATTMNADKEWGNIKHNSVVFLNDGHFWTHGKILGGYISNSTIYLGDKSITIPSIELFDLRYMSKDPEYVDLDLPSGLVWTRCNLGANSETEAGLYFSWGNTTGYNASSGYTFNSTSYSTTEGKQLSANLTYANDPISKAIGGDWRLPTKEDFDELRANTTVSYTTVNGVNGVKFTSKTDSSKYLFLPYAGVYEGNKPGDVGTSGAYWTSSYYNAGNAYIEYDADFGGHGTTIFTRSSGCNVRGVKKGPAKIYKNGLNQDGIVTGPTLSNANMAWMTDSNGNPAWRAVSNQTYKLTLNGTTLGDTTSKGTSLGSFYAPTTIGNKNQIIVVNEDAQGNKTLVWRDLLNSNVTSHLYVGVKDVGSSGANNTNGNTYLKLYEGTEAGELIKISGGTGISVTNDANGIIITNTSPDLNHNTDTKLTTEATTSKMYLVGKTDGNKTATSTGVYDAKIYATNGALTVDSLSATNAIVGSNIWDIVSINKTLALTTNWQDTGIAGNNLTSGTYVVLVYTGNSNNSTWWYERFSGIMSWYDGGTNSADADEIILHAAGHATNNTRIYLRTIRTASPGTMKLLIACSANKSSATYYFKFKRLI